MIYSKIPFEPFVSVFKDLYVHSLRKTVESVDNDGIMSENDMITLSNLLFGTVNPNRTHNLVLISEGSFSSTLEKLVLLIAANVDVSALTFFGDNRGRGRDPQLLMSDLAVSLLSTPRPEDFSPTETYYSDNYRTHRETREFDDDCLRLEVYKNRNTGHHCTYYLTKKEVEQAV